MLNCLFTSADSAHFLTKCVAPRSAGWSLRALSEKNVSCEVCKSTIHHDGSVRYYFYSSMHMISYKSIANIFFTLFNPKIHDQMHL